ncbi:MAG TPA: DUF72 domain-containing protein [Candidatus Acidoferrum sp.]|nr:DUF72 domain-containing protein [Candidatus Acidoferrum sp.]
MPTPEQGGCTIPQAGQLRVGTSGYSYKQWKGNFYPEKLPDREMLSFYGKQFSTVEINHSFYRMPTESALSNWAKSVPEGFRFALKANQKITHIKRLRDCADTLKRFLEVASILNDGDHLGPILVQLPPNFKFDRPLLEDFLALRPPAFRFAFEVRHASWYTDETYAVLRKHETALCLSETDKQTPPDVLTANFTYVRLRLENYTPKQLAAWRKRFDTWLAQGVDVYAYCKHEDEGKAPADARRLLGESK